MLLAPNFRLVEFERSQIAARHGIDNSVPDELLPNVMRTAAMLQRIRDHLTRLLGRDCPIHVSSGYRSPRVNLLAGGAGNSDHLYGLAADWTPTYVGPPSSVVRLLAPYVDGLGIGQLIDEFPPSGWIHTSVRQPDVAENRVMVIDSRGGRPLLA